MGEPVRVVHAVAAQTPDGIITDRDVPDGWFVLWCPTCLVSLAWTRDTLQEFQFDDWAAALNWASQNIEHDHDPVRGD